MASIVNAVLCALSAGLFYTLVGFALGRQVLPRALALRAAPVIGWAAYSALSLPIYVWIGLTSTTVFALGALAVVASGLLLAALSSESETKDSPFVPAWATALMFAAAALLALAPAAAILPKIHGDAVQFADPIFDHSKSAFIDAMARLGVPPVNPVFGEAGTPARLAYYYLWHFSAAELALATGAMGWEADIGLTWFTAFASLSLMMGAAIWISKKPAAALWVVALALAGALWTTIYWLCGTDDLRPVLWPSAGMAGWLFQSAWVPQHVMAASCAMAAMLLMARAASPHSWLLVLTLSLLVAAGFESSTFVGGVTFGIAAVVAAPLLFISTAPAQRFRLAVSLALAALLVIGLIAPFVRDQLASVQARSGAAPIAVSSYTVFGTALPYGLRRLLDLPGFWLIVVPAELPAVFVAGGIAFVVALRGMRPSAEKRTLALLACLAGAGLAVSWLLVSTLGDNNDLGLRAIIPAAMALIVCTATVAAGIADARLRRLVVAMALIGLALSLPDTAKMIGDNVAGRPRPGGTEFAQAPELWAAVRRYAAPAARVANNPASLKDLTPWPVNVSWALLSNRSSCFAEADLALAYAPLPAVLRHAIAKQFADVFAGKGSAEDVHDIVHDMATRYDCAVAVVVPSDPAWDRDPFATSSDYRLAETRNGRWKIYLRR